MPQLNSLPASEKNATTLLAESFGPRLQHHTLLPEGLYLIQRPQCFAQLMLQMWTTLFYRRGRNKKPVKVLRHFPIIPRLKWMYGTKYFANLMIWWADNRSHDGAMRFPAVRCTSMESRGPYFWGFWKWGSQCAMTSEYKRCEPFFIQKLHVEHPAHRRNDFWICFHGWCLNFFIFFI